MNDHTIAQLLDIAYSDSSITDIHIDGHTKFITVSKNIPHDLFCPLCGSRIHSKGQFKRHPNDQILQDGYLIDLTVVGRRWKCSNLDCSYTCTDRFDFLEKRKRTSKIIPLQIIMAFKDIHLTCAQIARRFHVSDTYAH